MAKSGPPTPLVVWADLTKFGRMASKDLNFVAAVIKKAISKQPTKSVALVVSPHLISERVGGDQRGEVRSLDLDLTFWQMFNTKGSSSCFLDPYSNFSFHCNLSWF